MAYVFDLPVPPSLPVRGDTRRFPVRRIYCVGRNYADHIREMGGDEREPPFFFQKPNDAIVQHGATVDYPPCTADFQHEAELVLAIGRPARHLGIDDVAAAVYGYAVGIDLTRRDVQVAARKSGRPWEIGKSFDQSAPCSEIVPVAPGGLPEQGRLELTVNGQVRQQGDIRQMIWSPLEIVAKLSEQYALEAGDLIFTGTPAGVGPLARGDEVTVSFAGACTLTISVG